MYCVLCIYFIQFSLILLLSFGYPIKKKYFVKYQNNFLYYQGNEKFSQFLIMAVQYLSNLCY